MTKHNIAVTTSLRIGVLGENMTRHTDTSYENIESFHMGNTL